MEFVTLAIAIAAAVLAASSALLVLQLALRAQRETTVRLFDLILSIQNKSDRAAHDVSVAVTSELRETVRRSVREAVHDVAEGEQAWFWRPSWQHGEREADLEIARGEGVRFDSEDDFDSFLREQPAADDPAHVTNKG